ncbi:hypothetical protein DIPPA_30393 [Diplonema papillatum]|nr:hypothetical protein DIPPA_30393 [Diplonema papillatum]
MIRPSIQNLTMLLAAVLVILAGGITSVTSIKAGWDAVDDSRESGDRNVAGCLSAGTENAEMLADRLMKTMLNVTANAVVDHISVPLVVLDSIMHQLRALHPDVTTSPEWIDTTLRTMLASFHQKMSSHGLRQIMYEALDFSPNSSPTGPWGGFIGFVWSSDMANRIGGHSHFPVVIATRNEETNTFGTNRANVTTGKAGPSGKMVDADKPCNAAVIYSEDDDDVYGFCSMPWWIGTRGDPNWVRVGEETLYNAFVDDGSTLLPADEPLWSGLFSTSGFMHVEISASWTHPEMINRGPRQENRVGFVRLWIGVAGVQTIVRDQNIVPGSVLYLIDHDQKTGSIGTMIGLNVGNLAVEQVDDAMRRSMINVTDIDIPVVSAHGDHVFNEMEGNYVAAADSTEPFLVWQYNGTVFWWRTTVVRKQGIYWYLTMMLPREEIMASIDGSQELIRDQTASDQRASDEEQQRNFMILMLSLAVLTLALLLLSSLAARRIVLPLLKLQDEMACVAHMQLERVDQNQAISRLSEVASMQTSFIKMVAKLVHYRNYMPQSILVNDTDATSDSDDKSTAHRSIRSASDVPTGHMANSINASGASRGASDRSTPMNPMADGIRRKCVSILYFNVLEWHTTVTSLFNNDSDMYVATHTAVLIVLLETINESNGVADIFIGDRLMANFNAVRPLATHRVSAITAGHTAKNRILRREDIPVNLSYAASSGDARIGNVGCTGMKRYTVFATAVPWVIAIERLNKTFNASGMCDESMMRDASVKFGARCLDKVLFPKRSHDYIKVYEVVSQHNYKEQEWMYQLRDGEHSEAEEWNRTMECVYVGDWTRALVGIESYTGERDQLFKRMQSFVKDRMYTPITHIDI